MYMFICIHIYYYVWTYDILYVYDIFNVICVTVSICISSPQSGRRHTALRGRGSEVLQPLWWSIGDGLQVPGIVLFYYINHMIPHVWWEKWERPDNRYKL